jgi:uncharacterized protein (DUF1697 family)
MTRYVALFRGINVGKAKRIAMADLRALFGKLGFTGVATLLNSGNAVFTADTTPADELARIIRAAVLAKLGVDAHVVVKSARDVAAIAKANALRSISTDDSRLLIVVTDEPKSLASVKPLENQLWGTERLLVGKHGAYLWCANGILESKAAEALLGKLGNRQTTRNWRTFQKIQALLESGPDGR